MKIEYAIEDVMRSIRFTREELIKRLDSLADDCRIHARRLKEGEPLYESLGIIQTRAPDIDRLCAQLSLFDKMLEKMNLIDVTPVDFSDNRLD